jgi:hypothetical protein
LTRKLKYILFGQILILVVASCKPYQWTTIDGKLKKTDKFRKYPKRSTSYKKTGIEIVRDTVANYVVSRTRYKESIGCFHYGIVRQKTITYNTKHKKIEKVIIRKGKKKTVEYFKNYDNAIISFEADSIINSKDTLRQNFETIKPK